MTDRATFGDADSAGIPGFAASPNE